MNLRDDGRAHGGKTLEETGEASGRRARLQRRAAIAHSLEVGARAEGLLTRPGQHDHPCLGVVLGGGEGDVELPHQRSRESIAHLGRFSVMRATPSSCATSSVS